jgi:hypothetical protein
MSLPHRVRDRGPDEDDPSIDAVRHETLRGGTRRRRAGAEGEGFEPKEVVTPLRFSRPPHRSPKSPSAKVLRVTPRSPIPICPPTLARATPTCPSSSSDGVLSPWENGYIESFNGKLSDELLDGEVFDTLLEAKVLIERYRVRYNTVRPHSSLGYRPPAPEAVVPWAPALGASLLGPAARAGAVGALT